MTSTEATVHTIVQESILLSLIAPSTTNPRKTFDKGALAELTESVRKQGVLQPILVRPRIKGPTRPEEYELVAGERRYRAAKAAGLEVIPCMVRDLSDAEVLEIHVIENLQRTDLHPLEEADGYRQLMAADKKYDVARIAERVGRSVKYVYDRVKLLELSKEAQQLFLDGEITAGHAILLARLSPTDQKRAIGDEDSSPLFVYEDVLFTPEEDEEAADPRKAISVRELQAWIDKHVKLEAAEADPMLFPETVATVKEATEEKEKVIRVTYDEMTPDELKDGPKAILGRSWKRADGKLGSKTCLHSVIGMIVIGPGRGDALRVCIDKQKCLTHWSEYQKAAKKRASAASKESKKTGEDRYAIQERKRKEENARFEAERARFKKARPEVLKTLAAAVRKASTSGGGPLAQLILGEIEDYNLKSKHAAVYMPVGKSADDFVRHAALLVLLRHSDDWRGIEELPPLAKAFGVDVAKIVNEVAPKPPEPAKEKPGKTKSKKVRKAARKSA